MPPCKEAEHESTGEAYFSRCKQYQEVLSKSQQRTKHFIWILLLVNRVDEVLNGD